jgi:hypothetical protein
MALLLSHWHCIIPAAAIIIAMIFMNRDKPKKKSDAADRKKEISYQDKTGG